MFTLIAVADSTPQTADAAPRPVCPHCLAPITDLDHFCPRCARPITAIAATDPLGSIHATGHVYTNAADRPTKLIHVIGIWLLFAPTLATFTVLALTTLLGRTQSGYSDSALERLWAIAWLLGLSWVSYKLLFRSTSRYIQHQHNTRALASVSPDA